MLITGLFQKFIPHVQATKPVSNPVIRQAEMGADLLSFPALEKLQQQTFETLAQKIDFQVVKKATIQTFLDGFHAKDKEYAQELLLQSADCLSMQGIAKKALQTANGNMCKVNLNLEGSTLSYLKQKSYKKPYENYTLEELTTALGKRAFHPSEIVQLIGKIQSEPLSKQEVKAIAQIPNIEIHDNGFEHKLNLFDFAVDPSGAYAKEKAAKIIERAKSQTSAATPKEAIALAIDEIKEDNLERINKARKKNGLSKVSVITTPKTEIATIEELTQHLSQQAITPESLMESFKSRNATIIKDINFLRLLGSDNGFTFYNPMKTLASLKEISSKLVNQIKKDGINPQDAVFVTRNKDKSDKIMGYMLTKIGDFHEDQFITHQEANKLAREGFFDDKAVVFLDDINGSGDTVNDLGAEIGSPIHQAKALYIAHLVSFEKARKNIDPLNNNITHIYHQNAISVEHPEHPIYKELSSPADFIMSSHKWESYEGTGGTQGFFFSIPDNLITPIRIPIENSLTANGIPSKAI